MSAVQTDQGPKASEYALILHKPAKHAYIT